MRKKFFGKKSPILLKMIFNTLPRLLKRFKQRIVLFENFGIFWNENLRFPSKWFLGVHYDFWSSSYEQFVVSRHFFSKNEIPLISSPMFFSLLWDCWYDLDKRFYKKIFQGKKCFRKILRFSLKWSSRLYHDYWKDLIKRLYNLRHLDFEEIKNPHISLKRVYWCSPTLLKWFGPKIIVSRQFCF